MKWMVALLAALFLAGCGNGDSIERALEQEIPSDVDVVENTCLRDGETAQGHEHWTCLLHYPKTALTDDIYRRWDVAVDNGEIVAASPQG